MNATLKLELKRFWRTPVLVIPYLAVIAYMGYSFFLDLQAFMLDQYTESYIWTYIQGWFKFSSLTFILLLYLSFVFYREKIVRKLDEAIQTYRPGRYHMFLITLGVFTVLLFPIFLLVTGTILWATYILMYNHAIFLCYILKLLAWYYLLTPLVAVLLGILLAQIKQENRAITVLVFVILVFLGKGQGLIMRVSSGTVSLEILNLIFSPFNLFPKGTDVIVPPAAMYPLLVDQRCLLYAWMAGILTFLVYCSPLCKKPKRFLQYSLALLTVICAILSALPVSYFPYDRFYRHQDDFYYAENPHDRERKANFRITKIVGDLDIYRLLKADISLTICDMVGQSDGLLRFTLYHGYKLKQVLLDGSPIVFRQDGDFISINLPSDYEAGEHDITMRYAGCSANCYSNEQAIFLPGYFAYLPHTGHLSLYSPETYGYKVLHYPEPVQFDLKINTSCPTFTNLKRQADGRYQGNSDGLTILGGILESVKVGEVTVVDTPLAWHHMNPEMIAADLNSVKDLGIADLGDKPILYTTKQVQRSLEEEFVMFTDHFLANGEGKLKYNITLAKLPDNYRVLYYHTQAYTSHPEDFPDYVSQSLQSLLEPDNPNREWAEEEGLLDFYQQLDKAFQNHSVEEIMEPVMHYFFQYSSDSPDFMEFLDELVNKN